MNYAKTWKKAIKGYTYEISILQYALAKNKVRSKME